MVLFSEIKFEILSRIHCTYMGGYASKEVPALARHGTVYDEINFGSFKINDAIPSFLGRCFIEVLA